MALPRNSTETSQSNQSIDFWSDENIFSESKQRLRNSFFNSPSVFAKSVEDFSKTLRESLNNKEKALVEELSHQHNLTLKEITDKRGELSEEQYDGSKFVVPEVTLGSHANMTQAYKAAYEELVKKTDKIETQAINYIKKLKKQTVDFKESTERNTVSAVKKVHEQSLHIIETEFNESLLSVSNSKVSQDSKLFKFILQFPPPEYFKQSQLSAASLLVFLNEDFNEYCSDMGLYSLDNKCQIIQKIFKGECQISENFREKTKMFFSLEKIDKHVTENSMAEEDLYLNLVQFLYNESPSTELTPRKSGQSWLVYFTKQLTLKRYSHKSLTESELVRSFIKNLQDHPELLNTSREVMLKFNEKFQIDIMVGKDISKSQLIAFSMEIDAFYSDFEVHKRNLTSAPSDFQVDFMSRRKEPDKLYHE